MSEKTGEVEVPTDQLKIGPGLKAGLALLEICVPGPTGYVAIPQSKVTVADVKNSIDVEIDKANRTSPKVLLNGPGWKALARNHSAAYRSIDEHSVSTKRGIMRIVPMSVVPKLITRLIGLRGERLTLAKELAARYEEEVVAPLRKRLPNYEEALKTFDRPEKLAAAFDILWQVYPLTPVTPDEFDLSQLNDADRRQIIDQTNAQISKQSGSLAESLVSSLVGGVHKAIAEILDKQKLSSGRVQQGTFTDVMTALNLLDNFSSVVNVKEVVDNSKKIRELLQTTSVQAINKSSEIQEQLKAVLSGFRTQVTGVAQEMHRQATTAVLRSRTI